MFLFYSSMVLIVIANTLYHVFQKLTPTMVSPTSAPLSEN